MATSSITTTSPALPREILQQMILYTQHPHGSGWDYYTSAAALRQLMQVSRVFRAIGREIWSSFQGVSLDCFSGPTHPFFDLFKSPDCSFIYPFRLDLYLNSQFRIYSSMAGHGDVSDQSSVERFFTGLAEASPRVRTLFADFRKPNSLRPEHIRKLVRVIRRDVRKVTVTFNGEEGEIFITWMEEIGQCIQLEELIMNFANPYGGLNVLPCVPFLGSAPPTLRIMHLSLGLERVWIPLLDWIVEGGGRLSVLYIGLAVIPSAHCSPDALLVGNVLAHPASGCLEELHLSATPISLDISNLPPSVATIHVPLYMQAYRGDDKGKLAGAVGTLASLLRRPRPVGVSSFNPLTIRLTINSPNFRAEPPNLASQIRMLDECLVNLLLRAVSPIKLYLRARIQDPEAVEAFVAEWLPGVGNIALLENISPTLEECYEWTMCMAKNTVRYHAGAY